MSVHFQNNRAGRPSWLMACIMILLTATLSYQLGQTRPDDMQWSEHTAGPLTCVSNGRDMQCAALQLAVVPGYVPQSVEPEHSAQQLGCIALAVFGEARGESYLGQAAVAQTVLNRASRAAQTPCDAVTDPAQYQAVERMRDDPWAVDAVAWQRALEVASVVASGDYDTGSCSTATEFHSGEPPSWAVKHRLVCRIGAHRFYAREG